MANQEWSRIWHNSQLDIELLQASYIHHAYPRHSHDYYVIAVVERGRQSFTHRGEKHFTGPGGIILINPGAVHTGEAADAGGFEMRCLYPTAVHMEAVAFELAGRHLQLPFFRDVRVDHLWARDNIVALHRAMTGPASVLECESRFTWTLAELVKRYADLHVAEQALGRERTTIQRARAYIDERFSEPISLSELAGHVSLSPYYLLRAFRAELGMPPHAYQESLRIGQAQGLIQAGHPLAQVAAEVGFSSQSHLTHRFKQIIGVTPGQYAAQNSQL